MPAVGALANQMLEDFSAEEKAMFLNLLGRFKRNADTVYTKTPLQTLGTKLVLP